MANIEATTRDLARRCNAVRKLLRPLTSRREGPVCQNTRSHSGDFVIAAHGGSPPRSGYPNWRFATTKAGFKAMYHERWVLLSAEEDRWYLDRAYLHIYKIDRTTAEEREYLLLHCDPNESDTAAHSKYKKGPHVHVHGGAEDPLPHSHFSLNLGHLSAVLSDLNSLTVAMTTAVVMFREEVLDAL